MIDDNKAYLYQTSELLIKDYGYQRMFAPDEKGIWLVNVQRDKFPLIYLLDQEELSEEKEEYVFESLRKQIEQISSRPIRLSIWNYSNRQQNFSSVMMEEFYLSKDDIPDAITEEYTNIQTVFELSTSSIETVNRIEKQYFEKPKKELNQRVHKAKQRKIPLSASVVLGICAVVFVAVNMLARVLNDEITALILFGALYDTPMVAAGEYWRLLTSGFIHIDFLHLLMNGMAFLSLSKLILLLYNERKMIVILLVSIITGGVAVFLFDVNKVTVGLSGGLYGLMGAAFIGLLLKGAMKNPSVRNSFIQTLTINVLISLMPGISLMGHLGGLVGGMFMGALYTYSKPKTALRTQFIVVSCILTFALSFRVGMKRDVYPLYIQNDIQVIDALKGTPFEFYGNHLESKFIELYERGN